jgi:hypothetical protein
VYLFVICGGVADKKLTIPDDPVCSVADRLRCCDGDTKMMGIVLELVVVPAMVKGIPCGV